jgi:hypothetical protein
MPKEQEDNIIWKRIVEPPIDQKEISDLYEDVRKPEVTKEGTVKVQTGPTKRTFFSSAES